MKLHHWLVAVFALSMATSANAYVDPGSGMLVWQGLIAALGAVIVFLRAPRDGIKRLVDRFKKRR